MPSLSTKDRAPLCLFSYEDGRRCRTPRFSSHPHFCFYHAQKESQSQATESLAKELDYFFSGDYLSACDLSTALSRLVPAVIRGHIKPRLARTVAYMLQTQLQAIHLAQHEYINAFGTDGWRNAVRTSVDANYGRVSPPDPADAEPDAAERDLAEPDLAEPEPIPTPPTRVQPSTQAAQATSVGAGLVYPEPRRARPAAPPAASENAGPVRPNAASQPTPTTRPTPTQAEAALAIARNLFPERISAGPTQPETPAAACAPPTNPATPTQPAQPTHPTPPPSEPPTQPRQPGGPTRDPYAVHYDHNYRLIVDGKPW
jgi:hypothetical protein